MRNGRVAGGNGSEQHHRLNVTQEVDRLRGTVTIDGDTYDIENGRVQANGAIIVQLRGRRGSRTHYALCH